MRFNTIQSLCRRRATEHAEAYQNLSDRARSWARSRVRLFRGCRWKSPVPDEERARNRRKPLQATDATALCTNRSTDERETVFSVGERRSLAGRRRPDDFQIQRTRESREADLAE